MVTSFRLKDLVIVPLKSFIRRSILDTSLRGAQMPIVYLFEVSQFTLAYHTRYFESDRKNLISIAAH